MRTVRLTESSDTHVMLNSGEAANLRKVGQSLASQKKWWGADPDDETASSPAVVRLHAVSDSMYSVRVSDAIGVIGLGETQLIVGPKIPLAHLLYLFAWSNHVPRHLLQRSLLGADANFFIVIAIWFVEHCEILLRHELIDDYDRFTDDLPCARGRIHVAATSRSFMSGKNMIRCDYDVRTADTSLNRVVKAAVFRLLNATSLPDGLRVRCRRIIYRLDGIGELRHGDTRARPDSHTRIYRDVHPLALLILDSTGVAMHQGAESLWTFLCRTPDAVETGLRNALAEKLGPHWSITKQGKNLAGDLKRSLHPDLVFGKTFAVGDIKYKLTPDGQIRRADLNQVTTFATGYGVSRATVVAFGAAEVGEYVRVGPVGVNGFNWDILEADPGRAADRLAEHVESWLMRSLVKP